MSPFVITTFVLMFILKLRFPSRIPFTTTIVNRYNQSTLNLYRKYERLEFKVRKIQLDINFLQKCKAYGIIPKFLNCKLYSQKAKRTLTYKQFQFKLLNYELSEKRKWLTSQMNLLNETKTKLRSSVSFIDFHCLSSRLIQSNNKKISNAETIHVKKLKALGISSQHKVNMEKVVINLSSKKLTDQEKEVLSLGLSFGLPNLKLNFIQHFFAFEKLIISVKNSIKSRSNLNNLLHNIGAIAYDSYNDFSKYKISFPKMPKCLYNALKSLRSDNSIIITKPDKGRGTVVMNKKDYINKVENILNDTTKFKQITEDTFKFITRLEDKLGRLLRKLLKLKIINNDTFNFVFKSGSSPGILYGLPKTHKKETPVRPVLSTIGTFNYNLAKFFVPLLEPITTNIYSLKNSFEFVNDIKKLNINKKVMASFDVESLFTNIPLNETIDIIINNLFGDTDDFMKFSPKQFRDLLELAVKECPFQFNNKIYTQLDGVAMGSCLGPTFANAFLCYHETIWLADCPSSFKPVYYRRYVDDTFLVFDNEEHIPLFLDYLNSKHNNIRFTYEIENNGKLPFLDVLVTRTNDGITTSVYRKPSFTGLGTNYMSFIPRIFKINAIKTLLYRCYTISSDWFIFHNEVKYLTNFFLNNGFPRNVIDNCVSKFLNHTYKKPVHTEQSNIHYLKLPFYGHLSYVIRKRLDKILKTNFPNDEFRFVFSNPFTIKSFFPFKDRISSLLKSHIVYQYECPICKCRYVGETSRNLTLRYAEHRGISSRTGHILSSPSFSAIREHSHNQDHPYSINNFKILSSANSSTDIKLLEALFIKTTKPSLNNQLTSNVLNLNYNTFDTDEHKTEQTT